MSESSQKPAVKRTVNNENEPSTNPAKKIKLDFKDTLSDKATNVNLLYKLCKDGEEFTAELLENYYNELQSSTLQRLSNRTSFENHTVLKNVTQNLGSRFYFVQHRRPRDVGALLRFSDPANELFRALQEYFKIDHVYYASGSEDDKVNLLEHEHAFNRSFNIIRKTVELNNAERDGYLILTTYLPLNERSVRSLEDKIARGKSPTSPSNGEEENNYVLEVPKVKEETASQLQSTSAADDQDLQVCSTDLPSTDRMYNEMLKEDLFERKKSICDAANEFFSKRRTEMNQLFCVPSPKITFTSQKEVVIEAVRKEPNRVFHVSSKRLDFEFLLSTCNMKHWRSKRIWNQIELHHVYVLKYAYNDHDDVLKRLAELNLTWINHSSEQIRNKDHDRSCHLLVIVAYNPASGVSFDYVCDMIKQLDQKQD